MRVTENDEAMVSLSAAGIPFQIYDAVIPPSTDKDIFVREGVVYALRKAQISLTRMAPGAVLQVFYGYRSPEVQRQKYDEVRRSEGLENDFSEAAQERIHRYIAAPDVAGHPTGGAVDVLVVGPDGRIWDMGTPPHGLTEDSYVFSPYTEESAYRRRMILRRAMMVGGFAPFDGEWWHFSYGDREWAAWRKKAAAFYGPVARPQ